MKNFLRKTTNEGNVIPALKIELFTMIAVNTDALKKSKTAL
jgi:hypothetical protein